VGFSLLEKLVSLDLFVLDPRKMKEQTLLLSNSNLENKQNYVKEVDHQHRSFAFVSDCSTKIPFVVADPVL